MLFGVFHIDNGEEKAACLCNDCCQCRACCGHMKQSYKNQIQNDIDGAGDQYKQKWRSGIAHATENTADRVIGCDEDHTGSTNTNVCNGFGQCFFWNMHQQGCLFCKTNQNNSNHQSDTGEKFDLSGNNMSCFFRFFRADGLPQQYRYTHGQTGYNDGCRLHDLSASSNSGNACGGTEFPHDHQVNAAVQSLKYQRHHQRDCKTNQGRSNFSFQKCVVFHKILLAKKR